MFDKDTRWTKTSSFRLILLSLLFPGGNSLPGKQLRIYNGEDAQPSELPFVVQVLADIQFDTSSVTRQNLCGGSLIGPNVVLTAAHCVLRDAGGYGEVNRNRFYYPFQIGVWFGDLNEIGGDNQQFRSVKAFVVHKDYDSFSVQNDIALIVLASAVEYNTYTSPIQLPPEDTTLYEEGSPVTVAGWGYTEHEQTSLVLQKLSYEMTSEKVCRRSYGDQILPGMICSGQRPLERRSAMGDSGGPLFTRLNNRWVQLGIVSWGAEIINEDSYDVNTNVAFFKDWISSKISTMDTETIINQTALETESTIKFRNLESFAFKRFLITADGESSFVKLVLKKGYLNEDSFIIVYDGDLNLTNIKMLAQLSGRIRSYAVTSTSRSLTVILMCGDRGNQDSVTMTIQAQQISDPVPKNVKLKCPRGFSPCRNRNYCLENHHFCDEIGQCNDGSDEVDEVCHEVQDKVSPTYYVQVPTDHPPTRPPCDNGDCERSSGAKAVGLQLVLFGVFNCLSFF